MKMFIASLWLVSSVSAFAKANVEAVGNREFEEFVISSYTGGKVVVNIDRATVRVDCHGLAYLYTKDVLSTREIVIGKQALAHTMEMCGPGTDHSAVTGISFTVDFGKYGGSETILAPIGSKIIVENK